MSSASAPLNNDSLTNPQSQAALPKYCPIAKEQQYTFTSNYIMMIELVNTLITKTGELKDELKSTGLWQKEIPAWVMEYDGESDITKTDFAQWLQFVFIPNHLQKNRSVPAAEKKFIVPQAIKYFSDDVKKGKLLQILIEIDSLL